MSGVFARGELPRLSIAVQRPVPIRVLTNSRPGRALGLPGMLPNVLGVIAIHEQAYARAQVWYSECLLFAREIGKYTAFAKCLVGFAGIANAGKSFERAARLVGAAGAELETRKIHLETNFDRAELQRLTTILRDELGEARFDELADEGRTITLEQAIQYALEKK